MGPERAYAYEPERIEALRRRHHRGGPLEREFYVSAES